MITTRTLRDYHSTVLTRASSCCKHRVPEQASTGTMQQIQGLSTFAHIRHCCAITCIWQTSSKGLLICTHMKGRWKVSPPTILGLEPKRYGGSLFNRRGEWGETQPIGSRLTSGITYTSKRGSSLPSNGLRPPWTSLIDMYVVPGTVKPERGNQQQVHPVGT